MIEEAIIGHLLDTMGVSALVSNRVYPLSLPQGRTLPAMTVQRVSGAPLYADDGEAGLVNPRVQVDCWGATYAAAKLSARAAVTALSAYVGDMGGVEVQYVLLEDERDMPRESGANAAEYVFRVSLDFIVWHS